MSEERARHRAAKPPTTKTRSKRCSGCPSRGNSRERSCKVHRICDEYDLTLRDHAPGRTHDEYVQMQQLIEAGYSVAKSTYPRSSKIGPSPEDFINVLCQAHRMTFGEVHAWAGRFRAPGEPVHVGHNHHEFEGTNPTAIRDELVQLWQGLGRETAVPLAGQQDAEWKFAVWAAVFLERFLTIHPFLDGNGRIGRFIVEVIAEQSGFVVGQPFASMDSKDARRDRRDYLYALQYAHKYCGVSPAAHLLGVGHRRDPHYFLACWWAKRLLDLTRFDDEEVPSWIEEELFDSEDRDADRWEETFDDDDG